MNKQFVDLLAWVILQCAYCEKESDLHEFHWQYYMGQGGILQAICPKCKKINVVLIELKRE